MSAVPAERLVFESSFSTLLLAFKPQLTAPVSAELKAAGLDVTRLLPAYPVEVFRAVVQIIGRAAFPDLPAPEQHFKVGRAYLSTFSGTLMGRALRTLAAAAGNRRTVDWLRRGFSSTNNFTVTRLQTVDEHTVHVIVEGITLVDFLRGVLDSAGDWTRGAKAQVRVLAFDGNTATFELRWPNG